MTVLVVDDTSILRKILSDILFEYCNIPRHNVHEAADGVQALREYKRHQPDVVFLDIAMPKLNGKDAVKLLLKIDPDAKVVMCTGEGSRGMVRECIQAGAKDYLVKPLQPIRVIEAFDKMMGTGYAAKYKRDHAVNSGQKVKA